MPGHSTNIKTIFTVVGGPGQQETTRYHEQMGQSLLEGANKVSASRGLARTTVATCCAGIPWQAL